MAHKPSSLLGWLAGKQLGLPLESESPLEFGVVLGFMSTRCHSESVEDVLPSDVTKAVPFLSLPDIYS